MRYFIVHAHHEPKSFNSALTHHAVAVLSAAGHTVEVSDLYAMHFDPVSDRRNFTTTKDASYLKQQQEELHASANAGFVAQIQAEIDKLERCDVLVFQFPLWWFGLPAILKGWCDRVLAMGRVYGGGRWYEHGIGAGKLALASLTTGGPRSLYARGSLNPAIDSVLQPIQHGIFWFNGFAPVEPSIVWSPARLSDSDRAAALARHGERLLAIDHLPRVPSLPSSAFITEDGSFRDRCSHFIACWTCTSNNDPAPAPAIETRLSQLVHTAQSVREHRTRADGRRGWITLRAIDRASALALCAELAPYANLDWELDELATAPAS
jgi:NAD(P)H dehydrogenase (quinone)